MRIFCTLCFTCLLLLKADTFNGFLEHIYSELSELKLDEEQERNLRIVIKDHHIFLRQWYLDSKKNYDEIMSNFANSSLERFSAELMQDHLLSTERVRAEQEFIMRVYEILDESQRRKFNKNNEQNHTSKAVKNTIIDFKTNIN